MQGVNSSIFLLHGSTVTVFSLKSRDIWCRVFQPFSLCSYIDFDVRDQTLVSDQFIVGAFFSQNLYMNEESSFVTLWRGNFNRLHKYPLPKSQYIKGTKYFDSSRQFIL